MCKERVSHLMLAFDNNTQFIDIKTLAKGAQPNVEIVCASTLFKSIDGFINTEILSE